MCGRYTNTANPSLLADHFGLVDVPDPVGRRYNVAPTDEVMIAVARPEGLLARTVRWGLIPHWAKDRRGAARMINARSEDVQQRPAYRSLIRDGRHRCLVLADGYYEWLRAEDPRQPRIPMRFHLPEGTPFAFAGLCSTWTSAEGEVVATTTILTTAANAVAAPIHDRMPVILADADARGAWLDPTLDGEGITALTRALPPGLLRVHPANPLVNSVRNDSPECLEPRSPIPASEPAA